ncbi:Uncharacterised protein [Escherichia coli]|nr:Uncharacterised protein [Escherichia coli]
MNCRPDKAFTLHPAEQQTQVQQPVIKLGSLIFARCITFNYSYALLLLLFI